MCSISSRSRSTLTSSSLSQETPLPHHHCAHTHTGGHVHHGTYAFKGHTRQHVHMRARTQAHTYLCTRMHTWPHTHAHTTPLSHNAHPTTHTHAVACPHRSVHFLMRAPVHLHICVPLKGCFSHREKYLWFFTLYTPPHLI